MTTQTFTINDTVIARYKTGKYIGKIIDLRGEDKAVVEVLAVITHPRQGDLHNPNATEGVLFHQRKALAFHEKAIMNTHSLKHYEEPVPNYLDSLREAVESHLKELNEQDTLWAKKATEQLLDLKQDYFKEKSR